jgi:hypothetical protein
MDKIELLNKLYDNFLFYREEIELLSDECAKPHFIAQSIKVEEVNPSYCTISFNFIAARTIMRVIRVNDTNSIDIEDLINDSTEIISDTFLGEKYFKDKRYIYAYDGQPIQVKKCDNSMTVKKVTPDDIFMFDKIKDEISEFESVEMLYDTINKNDGGVYCITENDEILSYVTMCEYKLLYNGKNIFEPNIYTVEKHRNKKLAQTMLSNVISDYYKNSYVTYSVDDDNIASNMVAKNIGLRFIGTYYRY